MSSETQGNLCSENCPSKMGILQCNISLSYSSWAKHLSREAVTEAINDSDTEVCTEIPDTVSQNTSIFVVVAAIVVKKKFLLT
jgi:hypothetical protein